MIDALVIGAGAAGLIAAVSDWRREGAYSWTPVGAEDAPRALGTPIDDTLLFAGEATEADKLGTVHGALDSGLRAAESAIRALRSASSRRSRA